MESVMTVRLNGDMKERAAAIMRREGYTPSSAVRKAMESVTSRVLSAAIMRREGSSSAHFTTAPSLEDCPRMASYDKVCLRTWLFARWWNS